MKTQAQVTKLSFAQGRYSKGACMCGFNFVKKPAHLNI